MKESDVKAEIEALNIDINKLKAELKNTKSVLFDLLEELKKAKIPYRDEYAGRSTKDEL